MDRHPNADSLYVEAIDLGEEQPRQARNFQPVSSETVLYILRSDSCDEVICMTCMVRGADRVGPSQFCTGGENAAAEGGSPVQSETGQDEGCAFFWHGKPPDA